MMVSKRNLLFLGAIFRFHVKLWEGMSILYIDITGSPKQGISAKKVANHCFEKKQLKRVFFVWESELPEEKIACPFRHPQVLAQV